jgi:hypothetical protein
VTYFLLAVAALLLAATLWAAGVPATAPHAARTGRTWPPRTTRR